MDIYYLTMEKLLSIDDPFEDDDWDYTDSEESVPSSRNSMSDLALSSYVEENNEEEVCEYEIPLQILCRVSRQKEEISLYFI
jgi:hypothetical protein